MMMWQKEKSYYQNYSPLHRVRKNLSQNLPPDWNQYYTNFQNWMTQHMKEEILKF